VTIIVGEDHQAPRVDRRFELLDAPVAQRCPSRDAEHLHGGERGLDAFRNTEHRHLWCQADRTAGRHTARAEHADLVDWRLGPGRRQIGLVDGRRLAASVGDHRQHGRMPSDRRPAMSDTHAETQALRIILHAHAAALKPSVYRIVRMYRSAALP
jgi:hypothetical protein